MNHALGKNLDWFWYQWFFTTYTFDQSIESVKIERGTARIVVRDKGDIVMPVVVRALYADGSSETITKPADIWFNGTRAVTVLIPLRGKSLKSVTIDPEKRFQDKDRSNNDWSATP
jgi:hypothetical protein